MTKEVAMVKVIMDVALKVHQKEIEFYEERIKDTEDERLIEHLERALYTERVRLKEVAYLMHEMEAEGLWE